MDIFGHVASQPQGRVPLVVVLKGDGLAMSELSNGLLAGLRWTGAHLVGLPP
jgi:hypothetical protein